ncbi:MAG: peptidylprolyl isomerase [PVC group bacterium]
MIIQGLTIGCAFLLLLAAPGREKIEARVNDSILTTAELNRILAPLFRQHELASRGQELSYRMAKTREGAINNWIEHQLILQEAQGIEGFQVDQMEIDKRFEESKAQFTTREEFDRALSLEGLDEEMYKKNLEDQFKVRALTYQKVTAVIAISPREIIGYHREHEDEYREDEMARVSHILIPTGEDSGKNEAARELAESILEELKSGADFAELARKHSGGPRADQGGDLGYFKRGHLRPQLDEAAFSLGVGENSGIIETELGYHVIKCTGKKDAFQKPMEELWEEIEDKLYQAEFQKRYDEWIKALKSRAHVIIEK